MTPEGAALPRSPKDRPLPVGIRIRLDPRVRSWADGSVLIGGSPWRISRLKAPVQHLVRRLAAAGPDGLSLDKPLDLSVARQLLDRGFADPLPPLDDCRRSDAAIVVPAMDHPENLAQILSSLWPRRAVVVDDGSRDPAAVADVTNAHGARLIRHAVNRGPAAARNTGLTDTRSPIVAFIDSDCIAEPGWPGNLVHHFDDPGVAAVAPRVAPTQEGASVLERYEATRSSLDMGHRPELVRPSARLGFVPSASLLVRRSALGAAGFDEDLRLGEDVDLVWRMAEAGWLVRYDPDIVVRHRTRTKPREWLVRRYEYGTSAAALEQRHPGGLTPARVSSWNLATLTLIGLGHPVAALCVSGAAGTMLWRQLRDLPHSPALAARTVGQGLVADVAAIGHMLRREWWPVGALVLMLAPRSRTARLGAVCILAPIAFEWAAQRPPLDPVRYSALRLVDDAAYGTGVISSTLKARNWATLRPHIRWPGRT